MALKTNTSQLAKSASSPAQGGNLSPLDIAHVAYAAGFRGDKLTMAVAISLAETGGSGNPKAVSSTNDYGLWQINQPSHPTYFKVANQIFDPSFNARAAFNISKGGADWSPWTTYKTGAYKHYFGQGIPTGPGADKIIGSGVKSNASGGFLGAIAGAENAIAGAASSLNPIKWVDEAAKNIVAFLKIMVDPVKLGEHAANVLIWLLKHLVKAIYNVLFLPPWRWTQRATLYYWENYIVADATVGGQRYAISVKAIATMSFWSVGYAILWGKFEPTEMRGVGAGDSALASTIGSGRDAYIARRITKPKDVEKNTAKKPEPKKTTVPLQVTRTLAAKRRRTVKVGDAQTMGDMSNGRGRDNTDSTAQDDNAQVASEETPNT